MNKVVINGNDLTILDVVNVCRHNYTVEISENSKEKINESRNYVKELIESEKIVYGITTGFGKFSEVFINKNDTKLLQQNLIESHTCAMGDPLPLDVVKAVLLLRANALCKGFSGIRLSVVETLVQLINKGICPLILEKGSLGASGDLAPLAMMALTLMGKGECYYKNELRETKNVLKECNITPVILEAKEGLALINGTNVMTAIGCLATYDALMLLKQANISASLTLEALRGITTAFDEKIHLARGQKGQIKVASDILKLLNGSQYTTKQGEVRTQDAYSLRCIPQVHGASLDAINYAIEKVEIEINAATDNPLIFSAEKEVISGGNFHGQPMALAFDFLGIAVSELSNIAERRIERLVNPQLNDLPAFLTENGGINSGFMITQYVAASMVSENKILAHPASVDSIPSSANQEDHVSMGTTASRKLRNILDNAQKVLGIECLVAAQALDFREKKTLGKGSKICYDIVRETVPFIENDTVMYKILDNMDKLVKSHKIVKCCDDILK